MRAALAAAFFAAAVQADAVKPGPDAARDRTRFGFNRAFPQMRKGHAPAAAAAFSAFNAAQGRTWKLRYSPRTGIPTSLVGGADTPRYGTPQEIGLSFINAHPDMLGLDPATLSFERQTRGAGHNHVLFRQSYKGLPVEFASVKVHIAPNGAVIGVHSSYEPNINLPTAPSVSASAAQATAAADAGGGTALGTPTLVVLPSETDGLPHLAWKLTVRAPGAAWRYYVDALAGQVLLRYNTHQFVSGTVTGQIFDIDPVKTPTRYARAFADQYVYVGGVPLRLTTDVSGNYTTAVNYPVAMSLQGPYVSVAEFRGTGAHYDNGGCSPGGGSCATQGGLWEQCTTPGATPNPYPFGGVYSSTLTAAACPYPAVSMIPEFSQFNVGVFSDQTQVGGEGGALVQDDQVGVYDPAGAALGSYVGLNPNIAPVPPGVFGNTNHGPESHGQSVLLALSAKGGSNSGYVVGVSSALYFVNPTAPGTLPSSHVWSSSDTFTPGTPTVSIDCPSPGAACPNLHGEISLFYHLNLMHDFFMNGSSGFYSTAYSPGVNACPSCPGGQYAPIPGPVAAMAHVGPDLLNAFFDPDFDDLFFGDGSGISPSDAFEDDATVPHHEYTHYIVNKIWSLVNFGQAGTISEANADYFSASSLNDPNIGSYINFFYGQYNGIYGTYGPLRALDCTANPPCYNLSANTPGWSGEIHADSPFVSQALWDIRKVMGQQCADNLEFQALLFFPESFNELYDALILADKAGAAGCGGAGMASSEITVAFNAHIPDAVSQSGEDAYEPNDSFDTATDISTIPVLSATIYPIGDQDFYTFGAGPGLVTATMKLPLTSYALSTYYAYQLQLFNSAHQIVASAAPPYNGIGTYGGYCQNGNSQISGCATSASQVSLSYNNPSGGQLYLEVLGGTLANGPSDVNSTTPYSLSVSYQHGNALASGIVTASYGGDTISFQVNVTTYVSTQLYHLAYVQLRDQGQNAMANTNTSLAGSVLALATQQNSGGQISGTVQLQPGYLSSFPAVGTVYLEVFGYDVLGSTVSLGVSNALNLTGSGAGSLTAYNNLFDPLKGQQAVIKYSTSGSGTMKLVIYTVLGEPVTTLFDGPVPEGMGSINWNGRNSAGNVVASGVYIVRGRGPGIDSTQKIVVVK